MELCSSVKDFSSFMEIHNGPSVVGENGGKDADSALHGPCENLSLTNDKEENEDGDDEVFGPEKESSIRSTRRKPGRPAKKRTTSEPVSRRGTKYPCGVCRRGVGTAGVICGACGQWIHNGKKTKCTGLDGKDKINVDEFKCPSCIENNREINLELRDRALAISKGAAKNCKSKKGDVTTGTKRMLPDPSPKKDVTGNPSTHKKQKVTTLDDTIDDDFVDVLGTPIFKTCIDCMENYEASYGEPSMTSCWSCDLASHGCRGHLKTQVKELFQISNGLIWLS